VRAVPEQNELAVTLRERAIDLLYGPPAGFSAWATQSIAPTAGRSYDAVAISGLNYIVTKDDTFKLRFTRDFTLRDEPEELNLKNVHAEWTLLRPGQRTRVPEALWRKLTDSAAGVDAAGNAVPAVRRVLYDERNGTDTRFGFGPEQTLAPAALLRSSILHAIVNTRLVDDSGASPVPDYIAALDFGESESWFATPASTRETMTAIWTGGTAQQVNAVFFVALNDVLAANYSLSDLFKTSRLAARSVRIVGKPPALPAYE
jgi:hypothetical protein